ncbi:MAG TPA: alpha-glucan family phosphorylase, partial [Halothiobacillaceae bacterium]|nr:alpha-glucan family phosphorylase [Halothiobacillaceae bacterium]
MVYLNKQVPSMNTTFTLEVRPQIPPRLERLAELANNLYYSWSRPARCLFASIDYDCWQQSGHNPHLLLQRVSQRRLEELAEDRDFLAFYDDVLYGFDREQQQPPADMISQAMPDGACVAYFCAEFGFDQSLPIYSGGLGILAGDHCKAASNLGLNLVGIGLLYRQGYFQQRVDNEGRQIAEYQNLDFNHLPVSPVYRGDSQLCFSIPIADRQVHVQAWQVLVGRIRVYLLDTDVPENSEDDRRITEQLYGGDQHIRIQQELVLGVGGVRLLSELNLAPQVYHINEGHAAFAILERCARLNEAGVSFPQAIEQVASNTLFTTHTPVAAGHDIFGLDFIEKYLACYPQRMGCDMADLLALGQTPGREHGFNMTALALRGSRHHNGVSQLHGDVASNMLADFWPEISPAENPVTSVTNGVHAETFLSRNLVQLFDQLRRDWRNHLHEPEIGALIHDCSDQRLWSIRLAAKRNLIETIRRRITAQCQRNQGRITQLHRQLQQLNSPTDEILLIGFARRFATYKRANLLFSDPERLAAILEQAPGPVVFVFAGKAHPADQPGQALLKAVWDISQDPRFIGKVLFLEGYDIALARDLVAGCDIWLNNPEYPLEASGTSGQKAGINGGLNLSVSDGWWVEGFQHYSIEQEKVANGWSIQPETNVQARQESQRIEAQDLLTLLETQAIPLFYQRDQHNLPKAWLKMVRAAIATILPQFNAARMVRDYVHQHY